MVLDGKTLKLAIIPARGGSKRIPRKNIKAFHGKPIMAYSIEAARNSEIFGEVMVSTDDEEIASIARRYGASVPFLRSAETSSDHATTVDVLLEVVENCRQMAREFSYICCIYPTAPFVTGEKLQNAFALLESSRSDSLIPVVPFSYPPFRGLTIHEGRLQMMWPENEAVRSQDLERLYHDCGQFYFIRSDALAREKTLFCHNTVAMQLPELEVQDIDSETDWVLAEQKYAFLKKLGKL